MNETFRNEYNTDMSKMAIQGYDIMNYFCDSFFLELESKASLMNDFQIEQIGQGHGNENSKSFVISQEEFELFNIEE